MNIVSARRHQTGESLISMMVGLLLAMLTIAAMLMTYKTMVGVSVPATRSSVREAQAAQALLVAQIELQQAGFGMRDTDVGPHIAVDSGGRRIVWRFRQQVTDAGWLCSGLQLVATAPVDPANDGIYRLPPVTCTGDATAPPAWAGADAPQLLASAAVLYEPTAVDDDPATASEVRGYDLSSARFRLLPNQDCGPFGTTSGDTDRTLVRLLDEGPATPVTVFAYCLTNT